MFIRSARKQRRQYRRYSLFVRAWVAVASITIPIAIRSQLEAAQMNKGLDPHIDTMS